MVESVKIEEELSPIPDKLYFPISEASELCALEPHVLRYWEQEFLQLKPIRRLGNRRYYQPKDIMLIRQIRKLLYEEGYTIEGAKAFFSREKSSDEPSSYNMHEILKGILAKLENLLVELEKEESS